MYPPAVFSSKGSLAHAELRRLILSGELAPGARLSQEKLAESMNMSITPLREAIRQLASEGLLAMTAHREVRVSEVSAIEARQLLQARLALEPAATRLAAQHRNEEDLREMTEAAERLLPINRASGERAVQAHRDFHRAVYIASKNDVMIRMLDELWDKSDRYRRLGLALPVGDTPRKADLAEHHEILALVEAGDGVRAEKLAHRHAAQSLTAAAVDALDDPAL